MPDEEVDGGSGGEPAADATGYTVTLVRDDGSTSTVRVAGDETVLEATDDADIDLRYGCREGKCVSCTARLVEGELSYYREPQALSDEQREAGFVLLCVAHPASDCTIEVGRSVLADAFPGLWRPESSTW